MTKLRKQIHKTGLSAKNHKFEIGKIFNYFLAFFVMGIVVIGNIIGLYVVLPVALNSWIFIILHVLLGNFETVMILASLIKAMTTSPGIVETDWDINLTKLEREEILSQEPCLKDGKSRYCSHCNIYKPPRVHHSQTLRKCVSRMDHYCIWVNNVVGLHNQKFFILFLLYACVGLLHLFTAGGYCMVVLAMEIKIIKNAIVFFILLIFMIFVCPLAMVLSIFISWTLYLLITNQTSIEYHRNRKIYSKIKRYCRFKKIKMPRICHIYNTGFIDNMSCVLGEKPIHWFNPFVGNDQQNGINYKSISKQRINELNELLKETRVKYSQVV